MTSSEYGDIGYSDRSRLRDAQKDALLNAREAEQNIINDIRRQQGQGANQAIGTRAVSTTPDNYGNSYAAAKDVRWVQIGQTTCYFVAGSAGTAVVVIVAAPAAVAAGKSALAGGNLLLTQPAVATELTLAYLSQHPEVAQDLLEGAVAGVDAFQGTDGGVGDKSLNAGLSVVANLGPGSVPGAAVRYKLKGMSGAQGTSYKQLQLKMCLTDGSVDAVGVDPYGPFLAPKINGNSKLSPKTAYLYRLEDDQGNFLKWGITQDMNKRYSKSFMADKRMFRVDQGSRADMLGIERDLVERLPGPLNFERWRGRRSENP